METTNEVVNRKIKIQGQWFKKENCIKRKKHDDQKCKKKPQRHNHFTANIYKNFSHKYMFNIERNDNRTYQVAYTYLKQK